jgi:Variant SH3 domain
MTTAVQINTAETGNYEQIIMTYGLTDDSVRAVYDYRPDDETLLGFAKGDIIEVISTLETGWWDGILNGKRGWFPSNYVAQGGDDNEDDVACGVVPSLYGSVSSQEKMPTISEDDVSEVHSKRQSEVSMSTNGDKAHGTLGSSRTSDSFGWDPELKEVYERFNHEPSNWDEYSKNIEILVGFLQRSALSENSDDLAQIVVQLKDTIQNMLSASNTIAEDSQLFVSYPTLKEKYNVLVTYLARLVKSSRDES